MTLFVVPGERHVERLAREGIRAETRSSLRARLAGALLPDVRFADAHETRLALAMALWPDRASATEQLDLFGSAEGSAAAGGDPVLSPLRRRGGASWVRLVEAIDAALGVLRGRGATVDDLDRVAMKGRGVLASRARTLAFAMRALDETLERAGARDGRLLGRALASAILTAEPATLVAELGDRSVRARWLLAWDQGDFAWWRALDERLARVGGGARVTLPAFERPLEGGRERDPLEILSDDVAKGLDAAPEPEPIPMVLGDLAGAPPDAAHAARVAVLRTRDPIVQAHVAASAVADALANGAAVERVVVATPTPDERTLAPLRRAFEERGIVLFEARGAPPSEAPVVVTAVLAIEAARTLDRHLVARLIRSRYVDAARIVDAGGDRRAAEHALARVAHALEVRRLAAGPDAGSRLLATVAASDAGSRRTVSDSGRSGAVSDAGSRRTVSDSGGSGAISDAGSSDSISDARTGDSFPCSRTSGSTSDAGGGVSTSDVGTSPIAAARALVAVLRRAEAPKTRLEHVRSARALWAALGIGAQAGRGGLAAFARDDPPEGVPRAERIAIARDARAWDSLLAALDTYERVAHASRALNDTIDADMFRLELLGTLDAGSARPSAGRAGAVRVARLAEVAGDDLDLLVVADANESILPRDAAPDTIVSETLGDALSRASRGAFAPLASSLSRARELAALATAAGDAARVLFTVPIEDGAGAPLAASPIVDVLLRAGVAAPSVAPGDGIAVSGEGSPASAPSLESAEVARRTERERVREAFFLDPRRPLSELVGELAPEVSALLSRDTGGGDRPLSVTGLERFARCPFMGFAHGVLAAREEERQGDLPDAREEGSLVHEALAAAFVATAELWPKRPRDEAAITSRAMAAADAVLVGHSGHAALAAVVRLRVRDAVSAIVAHALSDDAWDFAFAEKSFGSRENGAWPALVLDDGNGTRVSLRGTIDRVDRAHDHTLVRVLDYKRSRNTVREAGARLGETALQVPLYACVASAELGVPASGLYLPTQPRDLSAHSAPSAKVAKRMADLVAREVSGAATEIERRALGIVQSVRRGHLAPIPADDAICRTCSFSGGCRKPRFAMTPDDDDDDEGPP